MTQTITRERKQKFLAILEAYYQDNPPTQESTDFNKEVAEILALESLSRIEKYEPIRKFDASAYFQNNKREYFDIIKKYIPGASFKKIADARDEIVVRFCEAIESFGGDDVNKDMKTQARAMGISDKVLDFSERAGKALGFSIMPLDPVSVTAYEWIMAQEAHGQTIESFAEWARKEESKYMGKYRKEAGNIRNDWARAFGGVNEDRTTIVKRMS